MILAVSFLIASNLVTFSILIHERRSNDKLTMMVVEANRMIKKNVEMLRCMNALRSSISKLETIKGPDWKGASIQ